MVARRGCDILRFEERGSDFALVRITPDGSRSEIVLSPGNIVHLGLLAPSFSRRFLANRISKKPGALTISLRKIMLTASLRTIEVVLGTLEKSGGRLDPVVTERRARALASRLVERADALAKARQLAKR